MKNKKLFKVNVTDGCYDKFMYVVADSMDAAANAIDTCPWRVTSVDILAECTETKDNWRQLLIL